MLDTDCNYEKLKHSLNVHEDENNILRLKSRFDSLEALNHDQKNPILLRSNSLFTDLPILKFHEKCCRSGVNTFTAKGFSETKPFMHLSKHVFRSQ